MERKISFSHNWNNKLQCDFFSTIRLCPHPMYWELGALYDIYLKEKQYKQRAKLMYAYHFKLENLTPAMAFLDTGMDKIRAMVLFEKMYAHQNIDWRTQHLAFLVLGWESSFKTYAEDIKIMPSQIQIMAEA